LVVDESVPENVRDGSTAPKKIQDTTSARRRVSERTPVAAVETPVAAVESPVDPANAEQESVSSDLNPLTLEEIADLERSLGPLGADGFLALKTKERAPDSDKPLPPSAVEFYAKEEKRRLRRLRKLERAKKAFNQR